MLEYGTSWAQIESVHVRGSGLINPARRQMDLKDKWRNLVRLVTTPGKSSRGADLTLHQRETIMAFLQRQSSAAALYGGAERAQTE